MGLKNIVYAVYKPGVTYPPLYIGVGKKSKRALHTQVGPTHVKQAKDWMTLHHLGYVSPLEVLIIETYDTYEEASNSEIELIEKIQPEWNVLGTERGYVNFENRNKGKGYKRTIEKHSIDYLQLAAFNRKLCHEFIRDLFDSKEVDRDLSSNEIVELHRLASLEKPERDNPQNEKRIVWPDDEKSIFEELVFAYKNGSLSRLFERLVLIPFMLISGVFIIGHSYYSYEKSVEEEKNTLLIESYHALKGDGDDDILEKISSHLAKDEIKINK